MGTSDHRWYLDMVIRSRLYMQIGECVRAPGWLQVLIALIPCFLPDRVFENKEFAFDFCEVEGVPVYDKFTFSWIFRNWGDNCPIYWRWVQWYFVFYVFCYHFLRRIVNWLEPRIPKGRTLSAVALGGSMTIGVLMALFHYPNNVLENGTGLEWFWLELGADFLQPCLFVLGMTYVPLNMAWWGNTTLGCYVFHFYFRDQVTQWVMAITPGLSWDPTGLVLFILFVSFCILFTSIGRPLGHHFLLLPSKIYNIVQRHTAATRRRVQVREVHLVSAAGVSLQGGRS